MKKTYSVPRMVIYRIQAMKMMAASEGVGINDDYSGDDALSGGDALVRKNLDPWSQQW